MSSGGTNVVVIPNLASVTDSWLWLPPYRWVDATISSPASSNVVIAIACAARPLAVASGADAAFEARHALLEHRGRRVHDPRVDVAEPVEVEQVRGVLRVLEHVRGRLVDRHGTCAR